MGGPAVLLPRQQSKLARGRQRRARHVSRTQYRDRVIGIDIVKNSFNIVGLDP